MGRSHKQPQTIEDGRAIADSDDESIDDDEAFNSDDELRYGSFFSMTKKKSNNNKQSNSKKVRVKNIGDDESVEESEGDGGDDDDDGSSGSEEASYSDDNGDSDENDWAGSDDEDEEDDGGAYMLDLLNNLDNTNAASSGDNKSDTKKNDKYNGKIQMDSIPAESAVHFKESQFQAGALSSSGDKLTLDSLMGGIADTQGFSTVQKTMRVLSSGGGGDDNDKKLTTTAAPVSRVVSERASRKVHYEASSKDVAQWQQVVHEQRDAETLDFRPNKNQATTRVTRDMLVDKFEAKTEFEAELAKALEVAGMEDEKIMRQKEKKRLLAKGESGKDDMFSDDESLNNMNEADDDLGSNRISIEEYKKRHGELAKMRALMFYEEQKRNRINKIKSKKYRKIRKRQREREKEAENEAERLEDPNVDREKMEQEEMERMKERMTLAHKNTSKWARRVLRRGSKMDIEERRALSLQIAKGDELRRKMMGEDDDGGSDSEGETEEDLLRKARDILMENDDDTGAEGKKGLFQLAFMQRGQENQRKKAKEEARRLLEELEANELAAVSTDSEDDDDNDSKKKPKGKPVASAAETSKVLPEGKLVASSLQFGKADGFAIKVDGNIDLDDNEGTIKKVEDDSSSNEKPTKASKKKNKKAREKNKLNDAEASEESRNEENPWMAASTASKANKSSALKVDINGAASMLVDDPRQDKNEGKRKRESSESTPEESQEDKSSEGIAELSQAELVRKAFATPVDLEAEEEFQKEKERMAERDDPTRQSAKEVKAVSGWGSWAGAGAPPPKKPRKLPPKLQAPMKKVENAPKRKDDGMGTVIINEKRLKKTAKFQLSEIPYPYKSREEYERALAGNLGQEWNTLQGAKEVTRPSVLVRAGKIIQPITKKAKGPKRGPAKF